MNTTENYKATGGKGTIISNTSAQGGQLRVVSPEGTESQPGEIQSYSETTIPIQLGALYTINWDATQNKYTISKKEAHAQVTVTVTNGTTLITLDTFGSYPNPLTTSMECYVAKPASVPNGEFPVYVKKALSKSGTFPCAIIPPFTQSGITVVNGVDFVDFNPNSKGSGFE